MPTIFAHHDVEDRDHWLAATTREEFFKPLGVTSIREFIDPTNLGRVGLLLEVPDLEALMDALDGPEAAQAMAKDGVIGKTLVILVEA